MSDPQHWHLYDDPMNGGQLAWGSHRAALRVRALGYDLVILAANSFQDADGAVARAGVEIHYWPMVDDAFMTTLDTFKTAVEQRGAVIASQVAMGRKVLVTCLEGYNRSALLAARALYELKGWSGVAVLHELRSRRPECLFNEGFRDWILTWEGR